MTTKIVSFSGPYAFLSNFYEHSFFYAGDIWKTAEHAFQAAKADDPMDYFRIRHAETPGKAKRLGRHCRLRKGWDDIKIQVMIDVVTAKFYSSSMLEGALLKTGDALLLEGNTWGDRFWGVDAGTLKGRNELGEILMNLRSHLRP